MRSFERGIAFLKRERIPVVRNLSKYVTHARESNQLVELHDFATNRKEPKCYKIRFLRLQREYFENEVVRKLKGELSPKNLYIRAAEREGIRVKYSEIWSIAFSNLDQVHRDQLHLKSMELKLLLRIELEELSETEIIEAEFTIVRSMLTLMEIPRMASTKRCFLRFRESLQNDISKFLKFYCLVLRQTCSRLDDMLGDLCVPEPDSESYQLYGLRTRKPMSKRKKREALAREGSNCWIMALKLFSQSGLRSFYDLRSIGAIFRNMPENVRKNPLLFLKVFISLAGKNARRIFKEKQPTHGIYLPDGPIRW